jgi:hypothetical protein
MNNESNLAEDQNDAAFTPAAPVSAIQTLVEAMRVQHGETWGTDEEANLRFSLNAITSLKDVEGAHLIGEPEVDGSELTMTFWLDFAVDDLMTVDQLAFDIFARISDEVFLSERRLDQKTIRYRFVTGSDRHGHVGSLVLAGPYATDFVDRERVRTTGAVRFHA